MMIYDGDLAMGQVIGYALGGRLLTRGTRQSEP